MDANRFFVDLNTSLKGYFPMPQSLSANAAGLLTRVLWSAFEASQNFHVLDRTIACDATAELETACNELLRSTFQMPCEGVDVSIPTIDHISFFPREIHFSINRTYAAYVASAKRIPDAVCRSIHREETPRPLPLDETHRTDLVEALQAQIFQKNVMFNDHVIYALKHGKPMQPREAFGLKALESILDKLGAPTAP